MPLLLFDESLGFFLDAFENTAERIIAEPLIIRFRQNLIITDSLIIEKSGFFIIRLQQIIVFCGN